LQHIIFICIAVAESVKSSPDFSQLASTYHITKPPGFYTRLLHTLPRQHHWFAGS